MKKIILTVAAVFAFGFANAQDKKEGSSEGFAKGDVFITGSVGFGSESTGDVEMNTYSFSPRAGFFVSENIAVGLALGFEGGKDDNGAGTETTTTEFSIGAFGRYYFTPSSKFSVFGELGFNVLSDKVETDTTIGGTTVSTEAKANGFNIGLAPGVSYFLSDSFAIEAKWGVLNYETTEPDVDGAESTDSFNLGLNMDNISFGLLYKF